MSRAHAILSASGAKRWMACPPSAQLEETFPESTSEYADEGRFAHAYAEYRLKLELDMLSHEEEEREYSKLVASPYHTQALLDYIGNYVTVIMEKVSAARAVSPDAVVLLEQKLDFSHWVPEGFGTGDAVIISDGVLEVIDLKYGKGVPVSAEGNPQLRLYGLGAASQYGVLYDFDLIRMTIVQPRLDSISSEEMSVSGLLKWADEEVKPKATLAMAGKGEFVPGDHCQFCRAKAKCRKRAQENLELAKHDFMEPALLDDSEIADILAKADRLQKWAKDIQAFAFEQAEKHGVKWPGWKLVEGRSNRVINDNAAAIAKLKEEGYSSEVYMKPQELKGITDLEKALGKKIFEEYLGDFIVKPAGKPVLVPESDKRPEISSTQSAAADFAEVDPLS